jgi:hypothetical protein
MSHKITLIDKKTEKMNIFYIEDINKYIEYAKEVFLSEEFYVDMEPLVDLLSIEEYKKVIRSYPEAEDIIFPKKIKTADELYYWVQSWKVLEEIYELSLLK